MASDTPKSGEVAVMISEFASPSLATNDSNTILEEAISPQAHEVAAPTEAISDILPYNCNFIMALNTETTPMAAEFGSPSLTTNDSHMVLDETISPEAHELTLLSEAATYMNSPPLTANVRTVILESIGMISFEIQEVSSSTEPTPGIDLSSLPSDNSNMAFDEMVLPENQELAAPIEAVPDVASPSLVTDGPDIIPDEIISLEHRELTLSLEDTTDLNIPVSTTDAPNMVFEAMELSSPEVDEKSIIAETAADMAPASLTVSQAIELNSLNVEEESMWAQATTDMIAPSAVAHAATIASEPFQIIPPEAQELAVSTEVEASLDMDSASSPANTSTIAFKPTRMIQTSSPEMQDQSILAEKTPDMDSPILAAGCLDIDSQPIEMNSTHILEQSNPAEATPDKDSSCMVLDDEDVLSEPIKTSSTEIPKVVFSAKYFVDMASSMAADISSTISEPIEMSSPKIQEVLVFSEAIPDMDFTPLDFGGSNMVSEPVVTLTEIPEHDFSASATANTAVPFLAAEISNIASEDIEMSSPLERQDVAISAEATREIDFSPLATVDLSMVSELLEASSTEMPLVSLSETIEEITSPSMAADAPTVASEDIEMCSSPEMLEVPISPEATLGMDSALLATVDIETVPESAAASSLKVQEALVSAEDTPEMDPLVFGCSNMASESTKTGFPEIQKIAMPAGLPSLLSMDLEHADPDRPMAPKPTFVDIARAKFRTNPVNETIQLHIGPKNKCVLAHKHILVKSPYFASLLRKRPLDERSRQAHHFPTFDVYAFATIVHWLYCGDIGSIAEDYKEDDIFNTAHMVKVYCLCYKLGIRSLMNLAIELLGHGYLKNSSAPTIDDIDVAYSQTDEWTGLRIYMVTWARRRQQAPSENYLSVTPWNPDQFTALTNKHPDLLKDLLRIIDKETTAAYFIDLDPQDHDICWYHVHPEGELCGVAGHTFKTVCNEMRPRLGELI